MFPEVISFTLFSMSSDVYFLPVQDEMELNLRAEAILSRVLKENLCSRELEYEQLQADFATSVRARGILQTANQRLQDELSCLNHKMKDLELQVNVYMKDLLTFVF